MIHFIAWAAHWYVWLIIVLCKAEWWVLHCRPLLAAGAVWDLAVGTIGVMLKRARWYLTAAEEPGE